MHPEFPPRFLQSVGQDHIPDPERRKQYLAERPYIDHSLRRHDIQRRNRLPRIPELTVIIILYQISILCFRISHGLYPAGEGAGYAGGILSAGVDGIKVGEAVACAMLGLPVPSSGARGSGGAA